ncbi:MAG TPA: hypothetical protein VNO55_20595 [Polyangia bacterium]|nr:hypothetical protein [Polyangia bacterium]
MSLRAGGQRLTRFNRVVTMLSSRGLILLSVTLLLSCAGKSLDAVTGGDSGTDNGGSGGAGTGGAATGGAGTGGAGTGGAGTGGATTDGGGTGGAAMDGPADMSGETAGETGGGDICAAYVSESKMLAGISASDFCAKVATVCMFGADNQHYTSMNDCLMKYGGTSAAGRTCRAGYLCNKTRTGNPFDCPFAAGGGPCGLL